MKLVYRIIIFSSAMLFIAINPNATAYPAKEVPILQFPVMSDVHICGEPRVIDRIPICWNNTDHKFLKALEDYQRIAPSYQAIAVVGDLTNHGLEEQYDRFMDLLFTGSNPGAERILAMGNHEFFEMKLWNRPLLTNEMLLMRFLMKTGMENVYYDKWIAGYHFITLGSERMMPENPNAPYISDTQYRWLELKLSLNAASNKPIFVFLHQPIKDTVYGTERNYIDFDGKRLKNILRKYPQAILFSGHTHYTLDHPKTVYQKELTIVNTSSVSYVTSREGRKRGLSQGLLVNVYKDRVEIKAREFSNNTWIRSFTIQNRRN
ncbi:metallophosphoesterase [Bacillus sp. V5-8f]|uniref:metallophosphoesterase family protein n=1 Tax=Bacillus sp. V5-8f TaxID=2053044 RepID=UPI0015E12517|nr:metallophosphoesterase [Bacillus sp. V5-8f]